MPVPIVAPIPAQTVDGWDPVTITASASNAPTSWTFTLLTGPVTLNSSGNTVTFTAPALYDGTTVTVGVTASNSSGTSAQVIATVTVKVWSSFVYVTTGTVQVVLDGNGTVDVYDGGSTAVPADIVDGNSTGTSGPSGWVPRRPIRIYHAAAALTVIDGGTNVILPADILDGGTAAAVPVNVLDGGGTPPVSTIDAIDGGTVDTLPTDILDGGTTATTPTDVLDGGTAPALVGFGSTPFGSGPFGS